MFCNIQTGSHRQTLQNHKAQMKVTIELLCNNWIAQIMVGSGFYAKILDYDEVEGVVDANGYHEQGQSK